MERIKASKFRKELREFYGDEIHVNTLIDARNTQKKPYDSYALRKMLSTNNTRLKNGTFFALEFKEVGGTTINGSILKKHQAEHLLEVSENGGEAYVIVFFKKDPKLIKFFRINDWIESFGYDLATGKAIGMKADLCGYEVNRVKIDGVTTWNFPEMFGDK